MRVANAAILTFREAAKRDSLLMAFLEDKTRKNKDVDGDVRVGNDGSGSISVRDVGGDFSVGDDSSGGIRHRGVQGRGRAPEGPQASLFLSLGVAVGT